MAEAVGIAAAAAQFAELLFKAAKLAREVHAATATGLMARRITQLETFATVAKNIPESTVKDDPITANILQRYTPAVNSLVDQLERMKITDTDRRRDKAKKAIRSVLDKEDTETLFAQLQRDQMVLLMHRSFASQKYVSLLDSLFSKFLLHRYFGSPVH